VKRPPIPRGKGFSSRSPLARVAFERKERSEDKKKVERERLRTKRLRAVGKKGRENGRALRVFKKECARLGIERCEVRYSVCTGIPDTWAHGRKRRKLREGELETFAVAACKACHRVLDEDMTHEQMAAEVGRIISLRPDRYLEAA
jgi:hypothetical protein